MQKLLQKIMKEHKAVIFNGDNYYRGMAGGSGTPRLAEPPEHGGRRSRRSSQNPAYEALFEKYSVLSKRELPAATRSIWSGTARTSTTEARLCHGNRQDDDPSGGGSPPGRALRRRGLHARGLGKKH